MTLPLALYFFPIMTARDAVVTAPNWNQILISAFRGERVVYDKVMLMTWLNAPGLGV